jgi:hypothetical protein
MATRVQIVEFADVILVHQLDELWCHLIQQDEGLNDSREENTGGFFIIIRRRYLAGDFKDGFFLIHSSTPCTFQAGISRKGDTQRRWLWPRP